MGSLSLLLPGFPSFVFRLSSFLFPSEVLPPFRCILTVVRKDGVEYWEGVHSRTALRGRWKVEMRSPRGGGREQVLEGSSFIPLLSSLLSIIILPLLTAISTAARSSALFPEVHPHGAQFPGYMRDTAPCARPYPSKPTASDFLMLRREACVPNRSHQRSSSHSYPAAP
ncbi:hypothetical protein B0H13DRAFT_2689739 [Mycena leptocephala]|nr:hypothetical protein B0H13DRAFT_2689739 [Mycena leptocephala]